MPGTKAGKQGRQGKSKAERTAKRTVKVKLPVIRLDRAYQTLGLDPRAVSSTPQVTPILKSVPGGIKQIIEYLRGSDTDEARAWLGAYDDLPTSLRPIIPFEALCLLCKIDTKRMLEVVMGACFEQTDIASKLISAAAHPDVVKATVKSAIKDGSRGSKDREMLHKHANFLPLPNKTNVFAPGGIGQQNNQINTSNKLEIDQRISYQVAEITNIEKAQGRIADRYNEQLGMGAGHEHVPANQQVEHQQLSHTLTLVPREEQAAEQPEDPAPVL